MSEYLMTPSRLLLNQWLGMQPRRTVRRIMLNSLAYEMSGHGPTLSCWLWISKLLCGLDWTETRYVADHLSSCEQQINQTNRVPKQPVQFCCCFNIYVWIKVLEWTTDWNLTSYSHTANKTKQSLKSLWQKSQRLEFFLKNKLNN